MMEIFRTTEPNNELVKIDRLEKGCWINLTDPTQEELALIESSINVLPNFLRDPLDEEEKPRIDLDEEQTLLIVDIPYVYEDENTLKFETVPLGLLTVEDDYFLTICLKESSIIEKFKNGSVRNLFTFKKTRFILQILFNIAKDYLKYLRHIDKRTDYLEETLHKSMRNKELFKLLELQKSLVFFTSSLRSNEVVMEKLLRNRYIKLYEEDQDLLEDVIVENKQALEMANIYSTILNGMMDAFASVISNNLNNVMKILTSFTIVLAIPTMIFSFYGMNVPLPGGLSGRENPLMFLWLLLGSGIVTIISVVVLKRKQMF